MDEQGVFQCLSQKSYPYCQGMCPQSGTVRISIQLYLPPPNVRTKTDGLIIIFPKPKGDLMISPTKSNELKWKKLEARYKIILMI
ncbi:hypothetical protein NC651_024658 [Populus alba x Populus x berolinensis]|nr:hypothetical protein NC651_024658 [Populus alba x Populus x berolinensis]